MATASLLIACGVEDGAPANEVLPDRDAVVEEFGRAMLHGDVAAMADLRKPGLLDERSLEMFASGDFEQPPDVTVTGFGFSIVSEDDTSVEVTHSGERCAPSVSKRFGPTIAAEGESEFSSNGVIEYGEIECVDLEVAPRLLSPYRFVKIDDRWNWSPPGFG